MGNINVAGSPPERAQCFWRPCDDKDSTSLASGPGIVRFQRILPKGLTELGSCLCVYVIYRCKAEHTFQCSTSHAMLPATLQRELDDCLLHAFREGGSLQSRDRVKQMPARVKQSMHVKRVNCVGPNLGLRRSAQV